MTKRQVVEGRRHQRSSIRLGMRHGAGLFKQQIWAWLGCCAFCVKSFIFFARFSGQYFVSIFKVQASQLPLINMHRRIING